MKLSLPKKDIAVYIENLINSNFSDGVKINTLQLKNSIIFLVTSMSSYIIGQNIII